MVFGGVALGLPCGWAGHPVEIYTHPLSGCGGSSGGGRLSGRIYLGDDAWSADHCKTGQTVELLGIPEGQRYRFGMATFHGTRL